MAKSFYTDGVGNQQTLTNSQNVSIPVYATLQDTESDLPNLEDGDIVASYGDGNGLNDAPLGSIIAYWGSSDPVGGKWLVLDGRDTTGTDIELQTHYPSLYLHLGGTNILPDLRECVPVGIGQNGTDTIATHDVYTLGQFKDDQLQDVVLRMRTTTGEQGDAIPMTGSSTDYPKNISLVSSASRCGDTTHSKQKGVNWIIKAVSTVDVTPVPSESIQEIEGYVDDMFTVQETTDIGNYNFYSKSVKKINKMVFLDLEIYGSYSTLSTNSVNTVATLPEGFRPNKRCGLTIANVNGGNGQYKETWACEILTDGTIRVITGSVALDFCYIHTCFLTS